MLDLDQFQIDLFCLTTECTEHTTDFMVCLAGEQAALAAHEELRECILK